MASGKPYVYFDESKFSLFDIFLASTNLWDRRLRIWTDAKNPVPITLPSKRGKSVTVYGSIGNCVNDKFHYSLAESTN